MNKRNEGLDLLRCLAMLMIAVVHLFGHGGVLGALTPGSTGYNLATLVYTLVFCAVNCYALISGYVGVTARHRYRSLAYHWLVAVFWAVVLALIVPLIRPDAAQRPLLAAFFPVIHRYYWYFTAYFALFFLMPLINKGVAALTHTEAKRLVAGMLAVISGLSILPYINIASSFVVEDIYLLGNGMSLMWLAVMYTVGACVKAHGLGKDIAPWKLGTGLAVSVLAAWCFKLVVEQKVPMATRSLIDSNVLLYYHSPAMVSAALCLVLLFARCKTLPVKAGRVVRFIVPSTFSIYLIHEHSMVRGGLISGQLAPLAQDAPLIIVGKVLLGAIALYLICLLLDLARRGLFHLLHVRQLIDRVADHFSPEA